MFVPGTRNLVIIGAFVALGGLALAGWFRKNDRVSDYPFAAAVPYPAAASIQQPGTAVVPQPTYPAMGNQGPGPSFQYAEGQAGDGYYPSRMRPVYIRQQVVVPQYAETQREYVPAPRRVYVEQEYYTDNHGRRRSRSKAHSVEIVAGTAAVGAVIGGIAGGGKGAAIGAVSGGGAGFVYDRLTHNH